MLRDSFLEFSQPPLDSSTVYITFIFIYICAKINQKLSKQILSTKPVSLQIQSVCIKRIKVNKFNRYAYFGYICLYLRVGSCMTFFLSNVLNTKLGQHTWETDFKFIFYLFSWLFDLELPLLVKINTYVNLS